MPNSQPTFPAPPRDLPQRLNPFNPYHYVLLTYWVFCRPSVFHHYLYQGSPLVYRSQSFQRFWRGWGVPAYRRLYLMLPIALIVALGLALVGLWFYRQGMTAGHTSWVNSVAISGNGQVMVTAAGDRFERVQIVSSDSTLKVWNLAEGRELHTLRGHETSINAVDVTTDGKIAVSGGRDRTLKVWDLDRGRTLKTLTGHRGWISNLAILPNQSQVISASVDRTLKLWNLDTGENITTFSSHDKPVLVLALSQDGSQLVSGSEDQTVKIWDVARGELQQTLRGHQGWVNQVVFTPNLPTSAPLSDPTSAPLSNRRVISAATDQQIKVWDLSLGQEIATLTGHTSTINALAVSDDGHYLVSASSDRTLKVWDLQKNQLLHTLTGHQGWVTDLALTPQGKIISGSSDRTAKIWDLATGKLEHTLTGHQSWIRTVSATPDGERVISTGFERFPKLWAVNTGTEVPLVALRNQQFLFNVVFASCASGAAMAVVGAMAIVLALGFIIAGGMGAFAASLLITVGNSLLLSGALILLDRFRNNPSFREQFSAEVLIIVLYLLLGTMLGLTLGAASGLSGRRGLGVFSSLLFTLVIGFAGAVVTITLFTAAISIRGRVLPAVSTFRTVGILFNSMVAVGAFRIPIYLGEFLWSLVTWGRGKDHGILWDELLVFSLPGGGLFLKKQLQLDPLLGLEKCLAVMINPWQRSIAQRILFDYLDRHPSPIKLLYTWLEYPLLNEYFYPPINSPDWQLLSTKKQVLLRALGHVTYESEAGLIRLFTSWQRRSKVTPLSQFCALLYTLDTLNNLDIPDTQKLDQKSDQSSYLPSYLSSLSTSIAPLPYPGGQEVTQTFQLLGEFLSYTTLEDFQRPTPPEITNSLDLDFLDRLQQLLQIKTKIATLPSLTDSPNFTPALLSIIQALQSLRAPSIATPEAPLLAQIIQQWQEILLSLTTIPSKDK
jgi:WD40 repeat protein/chromate transport protein ChrA